MLHSATQYNTLQHTTTQLPSFFDVEHAPEMEITRQPDGERGRGSKRGRGVDKRRGGGWGGGDLSKCQSSHMTTA